MEKEQKVFKVQRLWYRFWHSTRRLNTKGSIAIEGAICSLSALMILAFMLNVVVVVQQSIQVNSMAADVARSLYNTGDLSPQSINNTIENVKSLEGVNANNVQIVVQVVPIGLLGGGGFTGIKTYGAASCLPEAGMNALFFVEAGGWLTPYSSGYRTAQALVGVDVCMQTQWFLNFAPLTLANIPPAFNGAATYLIPKYSK